MSSDCLENESAAAVARPSAQRLLLLLKSRGPQTASDLGGTLGITGEAARQQLAKLAQEGLVQGGLRIPRRRPTLTSLDDHGQRERPLS